MIGDIFVEKEVSYFLVLKQVAGYVENNLVKIGNVNVSIEITEQIVLEEDHFEENKIHRA